MAAFYSCITSGAWKSALSWGVSDQSQLLLATNHKFRDVAANSYLSQGFKPSVTAPLTRVTLTLLKSGSPTGNIWVEIYSDTGGKPNAIVAAGAISATMDVSTLTGTAATYPFQNFTTPPNLTSGTQYHIVVKSNTTLSITNYINVRYTTPSAYANGNMCEGDATPTWTAQATFDMYFNTFYGDYPGHTNTADTAIIVLPHAITIGADNDFVCGAITVNAGASLINNFSQGQSFCGAITMNGTYTQLANSKMRLAGNMVGSATSNFIFAGDPITKIGYAATLQFDCVSSGQYGLSTTNSKVTAIGTSAISKDCIFQGNGVGYEAYMYTTGGNLKYKNVYIDNTTIQYMYQRDGSYPSMSLSTLSNAVSDELYMGNIDFKYCTAYPLYLINSELQNSGTINIDASVSCSSGLHINSGALFTGNYTFVATRLEGSVRIYGGILNSLASLYIYGNMTQIFGGTINALNVQYTYGCLELWDGTINLDGYALVGYYSWNIYAGLFGGTININTGPNGMMLLGVLDGTTININGPITTTALNFTPETDLISGRINDMSRKAIIFTCRNKSFVNGNGLQLVSNSDWLTGNVYQNVEPFVIVTSEASKYFSILYNMYPSNQSDFVTTGSVDFYTTAGATVMTGASTCILPPCTPFQALTWGTFTASVSGGAPSYDYCLSTDGGVTYGAWIPIASGTAIGGTLAGQNKDTIKIRITNASGTLTVNNIQITNNTYSDITGWTRKNYLFPKMKPIKQLTAHTNLWMKL